MSKNDLTLLNKAIVEMAREDSAIFTQYIFGYKNAPFHNMWHKWLDVNDHGLLLSYRGSGKCLAWNTKICVKRNNEWIHILASLAKIGDEIYGWDENKFEPVITKIVNVFYNGIKPIYLIKTKYGKIVLVSDNHPFLTNLGWKEAKNLQKNDFIQRISSLNKEGNIDKQFCLYDQIVYCFSLYSDVSVGIETEHHTIILDDLITHNSEQMMGRVLWEIGKNQNIRIKLVTESIELSRSLLSKISSTIKQNEFFKQVFPEIEPDPIGEWSATKIRIKRTKQVKDATVEAAGVLTSKTGGRCDLLCFDKETEVLTKNGWKLFKDLLKEDKIATLKDQEYLEYQNFTNYIEKDFDGELLGFNGKAVDFYVTPKHNMYVGRIKGKCIYIKSPLILEPIENIYGKGRIYFKKDCKWNGKYIENIVIEKNKTSIKSDNFLRKEYICKSEDLLALIGFYIAEGSLKYKYGRPCAIEVSQNEGKIFNDILEIIKKLNFPYKIYHLKNTENNKHFIIRINSTSIANFFYQFGTKSYNKFIPEWILELNSELLNILYLWYKKGDGCFSSNYVCTVSKLLSDNLTEIALKCGFCLTLFVKKEGVMKSPSNGKICNTKKQYILTETNKKLTPNFMYGRNKYWNKKYYKDKVYCVTVPNSIIYVRRNGRSFWCGNCLDDVSGIRSSIIQPKLRAQIADTIFSNWFPMLDGPEARWYCIGTPWHIEDIVSQFRNNPDIPKSPEVKVGPNFESPWPERHSSEYFKELLKKYGRISFNRGYRLVAISSNETWINKDIVLSYRDFDLKLSDIATNKEIPKFMGVDLGHRSGKQNCPTVVFSFGILDNGKKVPCDIRVSHDASPLNISRLIINAAQEINPCIIFVENVGAQNYLIDILKTLGPGEHKIQGYFTSNQKMDLKTGVPSLLAEVESGKWIFPFGDGNDHDITCTCNMCKWLGEMCDFPNGSSDCLMASWLSLQAYRFIRGDSGKGNFSIWSWEN